MTTKEKINDLLNRNYEDFRTACNALKYVCENTGIRYKLVIDGGYGSRIKHVKWICEKPCCDNGGYPYMIIGYDPDWDEYSCIGTYNVDDETAGVCGNEWQSQEPIVELAYYFKERVENMQD